jgi:hypothetical protein
MLRHAESRSGSGCTGWGSVAARGGALHGCKHEIEGAVEPQCWRFTRSRRTQQAGVINFVSWRVTARGRLRSGIATRGRGLVGSDRV